MPRASKRILVLLLSTLLISLVAYIWLTHSLALQLLPRLTAELQSRGIEMASRSSQVEGLGLQLSGVSISGPALGTKITAEKLSARLNGRLGWPLFRLVIRVENAKLHSFSVAQRDHSTADPPRSRSDLPRWAQILGGLFYIEFALGKLEFPDGSAIQLEGQLRSLYSLEHNLVVLNQNFSPFLDGASWTGTTLLINQQLLSKGHSVLIGPFPIAADWQYSLEDQKWTVRLNIQEKNLSQPRNSLGEKAPAWFQSAKGAIELASTLQGLGSAIDSIQAEGLLRTKGMELNINLPNIAGKILADSDLSFRKGAGWSAKGSARVDLSQTDIKFDESFHKPPGTAFQFAAKVDGNERELQISELRTQFHNVVMQGAGSLKNWNAPHLDFAATIPRVTMDGWEVFFPMYDQTPSSGNLAAHIHFAGPLRELSSAKIDVDIDASALRMPAHLIPLRAEKLKLGGILLVDSKSRFVLANRSLAELSTRTTILGDGLAVSYSDWFRKPVQEKFSLVFNASTKGKRASLNTARIALGSIVATASGGVADISNPVPRLKLSLPPTQLSSLLSFYAGEKRKTVRNISGTLAAEVSYETTGVSGKISLARAAGQILLASRPTDPVQLKQLGGRIEFSNEKISQLELSALFPRSDIRLKGAAQLGNSPRLELVATSKKLNLEDFVTQSGRPAPAGMIGVPVQAEAGQTNDFRVDPLLKKLNARALIKISHTSLGGHEIADLLLPIRLNGLQLSIDRASWKMFGGTVESSTSWDGTQSTPVTKQQLKVTAVDADKFVSSYAPTLTGILYGRLGLVAEVTAQGLTGEAIRQSAAGSGTFSLTDGGIRTVRFTQAPLEQMKKLPIIGHEIAKTAWDEKLNAISGSFVQARGITTLSSTVLRSPYFSATAQETQISEKNEIEAKIKWSPSAALVGPRAMASLKEVNGTGAIPMRLAGPINSPKITLDTAELETQLKQKASQRIEEEKNRAARQITEEAKKQVGKALNGLIPGLR